MIEEPKEFVIVGKGKYKTWHDEKEGFIRTCLVGEVDERIAQKIKEAGEKHFKEHGELNVLVDLSKLTKISSRARKVFTELQRFQTQKKTAFFGASVFVRTVVNFIMAASGTKDTKHFTTEEEALRWLKEE